MKMKTTIQLMLLLALLGAPIAAQETKPQRVEVPLSKPGAPVVLHVESSFGSINVEAHDDTSKLIVELRPHALEKVKAAPEKPRTDGLRRIEDTSAGFEIIEEDNVVQVETEGHGGRRGVDVFVKAPVNTAVRLESHDGGEITVRGVRGAHEIDHHNGSITARGISGSLVAETHNGSITVELRAIDTGTPMAFSTWNGTIDVSFPPSLKAELVMQSEHGEILTAFDLALEANRPKVERGDGNEGFRLTQERTTRGKVGGGGPELRFETYNGDIIVRKSGG